MGLFSSKKKDDAKQQDTDALASAAAGLAASGPAAPAAAPVQFSDKSPEERERETVDLQAQYTHLREETSELISEPHPEIEREDTVMKAHERGEL
jgi:hypothetical protein